MIYDCLGHAPEGVKVTRLIFFKPFFTELSMRLTCCVQAFSRVVQKLIPQLPTLENLLNILISVSDVPAHVVVT